MSLEPTPSLLPTPAVAGYEALRLVGRGSMGAVYAARPVGGSEEVALKVLRVEVLDTAMGLTRFRREHEALRRIDHPGVTRVHEVGQLPDGRHFFAMELLRGKDLERCLDEETPARLAMVERVHEALAPLAAAHAADIVHRDLKPENIFLLDEPRDGVRVKLLDFGIARDLSDAGKKTATGVAVGSPAYMSPEQAAKPKTAGPQTDVWSVGVMLYELLAGELPYDGDSPTAVIVAVCTENHEPLARRSPGAHPKLVALIERCLSKRAVDRPRDAGALEAELGALLADEAVRATLVGVACTPLGRSVPPAAPADVAQAGTISLPNAAVHHAPADTADAEGPRLPPPRPRWGVRAAAVLCLGGVVGALVAAATYDADPEGEA
ncbi:MAG: serine/threonine-protein kinase, partial [Myxococcota bacterium]